VDKLSIVDLGPDGRIRKLILLEINVANLGNLPSGSLLTRGGQAKTLSERTEAVQSWVDGQFLHAPAGLIRATYSELAESFVHVLRAVNAAGLYTISLSPCWWNCSPHAPWSSAARTRTRTEVHCLRRS
jgi:hypothetical protein